MATLREALLIAVDHHQAGRLAEAEVLYRRVLDADANQPDALHFYGVLVAQSGRLSLAVELIGKAVAIRDGVADYHVNLGNALRLLERRSEAVVHYRRAAALRYDFPELWSSLGDVLSGMGEQGAAVAACRAAVAVQPGDAIGHVRLGRALRAAGFVDAAYGAFQRALAADPVCVAVLSSLSTLHRQRNAWAAALGVSRRAVVAAPEQGLALANLGIALGDNNRMDAAAVYLRRAVRVLPDDAETRKILGIMQLQRGELAEGFANYDWRWRSPEFREPRRNFPQPRWDGGNLAGERLLLWGEQGVGDELIYAGMIPDLVEAGVDCALECDPRLVPLLQRSFPAVEVVGRAADLSPPSLSRPASRHCPLGSIGQWLRPDFTRFPRRPSYLAADPARREQLRARYAAVRPGDRLVGLSWRSKNADLGRNKSLDLLDLAPVLTLPGMTFVNLQYGDCREELAAAQRELGVSIIADAEIDPLRDMDGFAAQVAALDLVISTSNATAHVAGGLGVPCRLMLPCGRGRIWYWFDGRGDSPWYPSIRIFRQDRPGDWTGVLAQAAAETVAPSP